MSDTFSDWLFVKSDDNGDIEEFQVQFRITYEDEIHYRKLNCQGYMMTFDIRYLTGKILPIIIN